MIINAQTHMLSYENAFQSYIHLHMHDLCAIVLHGVMHEVFIFAVAMLSACLYLRAGIEISSMLDEMVV
jgi:hypothetical protein